MQGNFDTNFVKKWVDYSSKYGLGYLLSNKATGIYFNDSSKIIMEPQGEYYFSYLGTLTMWAHLANYPCTQPVIPQPIDNLAKNSHSCNILVNTWMEIIMPANKNAWDHHCFATWRNGRNHNMELSFDWATKFCKLTSQISPRW